MNYHCLSKKMTRQILFKNQSRGKIIEDTMNTTIHEKDERIFYRSKYEGQQDVSGYRGMGCTSQSTQVQTPELIDCERRESTSQTCPVPTTCDSAPTNTYVHTTYTLIYTHTGSPPSTTTTIITNTK